MRSVFLYLAGIAFLFLAKSKNILQGYSSPKPFDLSESDRCIDYDFHIVDRWLQHLKKYTNEDNFLDNKNVLELGPGSDLGIGLYLLSQGCDQYNACDVNDLAKSTPARFYDRLFERLRKDVAEDDVAFLRTQLQESQLNRSSKLNYIVRDDFDIVQAFGENSIELVFSQAAFEHFDDIDATIEKLSIACKPGAVAIIEIDLMTHSRWIRDQDPNNIYRYPDWLFNLFWFRGIPNRKRPWQYKAAFAANGWKDISLTPLITVEGKQSSYAGVNKQFADKKNQMEYLSVLLCARL